ncbi:uncharacterized protein METZ01_LOCUS222497, partial [marine metagenome]
TLKDLRSHRQGRESPGAGYPRVIQRAGQRAAESLPGRHSRGQPGCRVVL